jgi:hypothetical protein
VVRTRFAGDWTRRRGGGRALDALRFGDRSHDDGDHEWRIDAGNEPAGAGPVRLAAVGFLGGVALGAVLWSSQIRRHRRALFSRSPLRRLAALAYLSVQPSSEAVRLLRDYVRWEPRSVLRRRGEQVLRQVEQSLD